MHLFRKQQKSISVIAEFDNTDQKTTLETIALLSEYITFACKKATITTDIQAHPTGYRVTYKILYKSYFEYNKNYSRQLARVSKWLTKTEKSTLHQYYYNINF